MVEKERTERRVYVLPSELVERLKSYQSANAIPSEVEAVRRLLDSALQMKDTARSLLDKLLDRSKSERDLRVLSRDVLALHALVEVIKIEDGTGLTFYLKDGSGGRLSHDLKAGVHDLGSYNDTFSSYPPKRSMNDIIDDEIPF